MKFLYLTLVSLSLSSKLFSQDGYEDYESVPFQYKPFRVDVTGGVAILPTNIWSGGVVAAIEPKYAVSDRFSVGFRTQGAGLVRTFYKMNTSDQYIRAQASAMLSTSITSDYYLAYQELRPYVGVGAGYYFYKAASFDANSSSTTDPGETAAGSKFGVLARAGLDLFHMKLGMEYNFVGKTGRTKNSYFALTAGFYFGGGRKKEKMDDY